MKFKGEKGVESDAVLDLPRADHVPNVIDGDELSFEFFVMIPVGWVGFGAIFDKDEVGAVR